MSMDDAYKMVEKLDKAEAAQSSGINQKEFTFIFAMSKMVVPEESRRGLEYLRVKFLEMVDLIGRVTILRNFNTQMEDLPLYK